MAGKLIIISSPSGGGKGTLIRELLAMHPELGFACSHTTRPKRVGEEDGREYFFISEKEFKQRIEAGDFLEYAIVHGNYYGTSIAESRKIFNTGKDLVVEVDVQGALQIMEKLRDDHFSVFILPPSFEVLRARLVARATEDSEELQMRLKNSFDEVLHYSKFDYVVINEDVATAARELASIVVAERKRPVRQANAIQVILDSFDASRHLFTGK